MDEPAARAISGWRYPGVYAFYDPERAAIPAMLDPANRYQRVLADGELVGYCCVGPDARVPGFAYSAEALDVGLGMRPDLTGRGLGAGFVSAVLEFAAAMGPPARLRLTVAAFNERALRVYERLGFRAVARFVSTGSEPGTEFVVMERPPA